MTTASSTEVPISTWEENTGLLSSLLPSTGASTALPSSSAYNQSQGQLKLGPAPLPDGLQDEAARVLREEAEAEADGDVVMSSGKTRRPPGSNDPPLVSPSLADLPPRPPSFKTIDVKREVEKARDARKRIRLEPATLSAADIEQGLDRKSLFVKASALPSVCAYTFQDALDG